MTFTARLGSLVDVVGGGTPSKSQPKYYAGAIPWVTPKDMKVWDITDAEDHITEEAVAESATRIVPTGAVLVVVRSGVLKHTLPIGIARRPVALNQDMKALICQPKLNPDYLAHFLKGSQPTILSAVRGTTADNIPVATLLNLDLTVPPLPVQELIVASFNHLSATLALRKEAVALADDLTRSVFLEMFGDPVDNPRGWPTKTLGDLALELRYGTSLPCVTERTATAWPVLRIPNVVGGEIDWGDLKFTELPRDAQEALKMLKGDVLFVRSNGNPEHIGRAAATREDAEAAFASYLIRARLRPEAGMLPDLLVAMMSTPSFRSLLTAQARTTAGNFNISAEALRRLPVIVPPMPLQERFVEALDEVRKLQETLKRSLAETEALYASLSDRYFGAP